MVPSGSWGSGDWLSSFGSNYTSPAEPYDPPAVAWTFSRVGFPMKILFLSSVFPNAIEESRGRFNDSLVRALAIGHQVEVVSPIPWVDLVKGRRLRIQVPMYRRIQDPAGFGIHYVPFLYTPKVLRRWYGEFYWSSIAGTIRSLIRTHRPELVIGYWAHPDGEGAVRIGRLVGVCSCVIIGGSDVLLVNHNPGRRGRVQEVLKLTDAVITVNDDLKRAVMRLGIPGDRVHVWRQGIDVGRFHSGERRLAREQLGIPVQGSVLVWVGRMVPVKGLDILLESCACCATVASSFISTLWVTARCAGSWSP